jgi:hypothetical protein
MFVRAVVTNAPLIISLSAGEMSVKFKFELLG